MASFEKIGSFVNPMSLHGVTNVGKDIDSSRIDNSQVQKTQDKLKFALVDSGMGGGMTSAFLRGEVRQLGSYFCLPIGDKSGNIATGYTAAMALWPLVAPLSDSSGGNDSRVAEHVIIACNSASVRKEGAIELMAKFCEDVYKNPEKYQGKLNDTIVENIRNLVDSSKGDLRGHLTSHVHEIVSKTAQEGVRQVSEILKSRDNAFVRIDSTNGTVNSGAYPDRFGDQLKEAGNKNVEVRHFRQDIDHEGSKYAIKHSVYTFENEEGQKKTVVVESRGNPPWVPDIEDNKVGQTGPLLAKKSLEASNKAIEKLLSDHPNLRSAFESVTPDHPEVSMLCCTHYPAMKESLEGQYGGGVVFINQATIVKEMAQKLDETQTDPGKGGLNLALTIGSQNYGGTPGNLKPSIGDGNATAKTLFNVLDTTLGGSHLEGNDWREISSVKVFQQGEPGEPGTVNPKDISSLGTKGVLQQQFELIHQFVAKPIKDQILSEQGLQEIDGTLQPKDDLSLVQPKVPEGTRTESIYKAFPKDLGEKFDDLGKLTTIGETRGIDKIGLFNDQGAQLRAAVSQIVAVKEWNVGKPPSEQERVGILTGFTVIDNPTGQRVGGENDGPPGAVIMARTLLLQGLPVTLVTDNSNEAALVSSLVGSGLATLNVAGNLKSPELRTLKDIDVVTKFAPDPDKPNVTIDLVPGQLKFEVPARDNRDTFVPQNPSDRSSNNVRRRQQDLPAIQETVKNLKDSNVNTMISIERPSITQGDGGIYSMLGLDVSPFNLDMSPTLRSGDYKPFTIGIGDGGNELGTGGISHITSGGRDETLQPFVKRGDFIGAKKDVGTDVMLLSTVSNNGGITLSMAMDSAMGLRKDGGWGGVPKEGELKDKLNSTLKTYNTIVNHMYEDVFTTRDQRGWTTQSGMSIDGVNKQNLPTVDGRRMGSLDEAKQRWDEMDGKVPLGVGPGTGPGVPLEGRPEDTSHNDTFLQFRNIFVPVNVNEPL